MLDDNDVDDDYDDVRWTATIPIPFQLVVAIKWNLTKFSYSERWCGTHLKILLNK